MKTLDASSVVLSVAELIDPLNWQSDIDMNIVLEVTGNWNVIVLLNAYRPDSVGSVENKMLESSTVRLNAEIIAEDDVTFLRVTLWLA
jgi:hypothetical protein